MMILVAYDVDTKTAEGKHRLYMVAKMCVNYGQRVQDSVFECLLDITQYAEFRKKLSALIDPETDSLRFYQIGNNYENKIIRIGKTNPYDQTGILII